MTAIARAHLHAGILGMAAAISAASVVTVSSEGVSASKYALGWVGLLTLILLAALAYTRPLITLVIALIFMTSPIPLVLSLQWSALMSGFLLGGAVLGLAMRTSFRTLTPDPLGWSVCIFAAYGMLSTAYGLWLGNEVGYVLGDCFQIAEFAVVYLLVTQLLNSEERVYLVLRWLLASMLVTILLELVLFALGPGAGGLLPSWNASVVSESLVRTIDINATILFTVLINLYPVARSRRNRFWIWVALIPTVANIALSLSRGLWLSTLIAALASVALQSRNKRRQFLKASALLGTCAVLLAAAWKIGADSEGSILSVFEERIVYGVDQVELGLAGTESMATRRFLEMAIVGPQVLARPWIGHGLGATYVIGGFAVLDSGTNALIDHHFIHNLYLVTAFRMGLIGLGLLLWLLARYFRKILRSYRSMGLDVNKALVAGFIAIVIGQLFLSLTQPTVIDHPTCALIACAMALSFRLAAISSQSNPVEAQHGV